MRARLLFALLIAACSQKTPAGASDAGSPPPSVPSTVASADAGSSATAPPAPKASVVPGRSLDECFEGDVRGGKSIGHTSTVFKLELADGKKVAWKPNAKKVRGRYKGEVAAFRLATALGIPNVLPACPRVFDLAQISGVLSANADAAGVLEREAIVDDGKIVGATVNWHDGLTFWPLEKEPLRSEARTWLSIDGAIPSAKADFARQVSTLVAFDFVTGNWDRYSGENVGLDKSGERVLYIDNDAAFMEALPKQAAARSESHLETVDRFSQSFVAGLRKLDEDALAHVFGEEAAGRPLLSPAVVKIVAKRVKKVLTVVDRKIGEHGEAATLYFP